MKRLAILLEYCLDFQKKKKKIDNPKTTTKNIPSKVKNKNMG